MEYTESRVNAGQPTERKFKNTSEDNAKTTTEEIFPKTSDEKEISSPCTTKSEFKEKRDSESKTEKELHFVNALTFAIRCQESKSWISNIQPLPNGNIIMADFNNCKLHIYNLSQEKQKAVSIPGNPCSIAVINDNKVAVSLNEKKTIALVNILTRKVYKFIDAGDCCHGITHNDDNLVVNCLEDGLKFIDLTGSVQIVKPEVKGEAYLCSSEKNHIIYCSVYWSHKILCYSKDGDEIYSFSNLTMKCPKGISVDNRGQVYTAEFAKNKIHMINSEGTKSRVILNRKHGISNPLCVMFFNSCLYVSNNDGETVTIFKRI